MKWIRRPLIGWASQCIRKTHYRDVCRVCVCVCGGGGGGVHDEAVSVEGWDQYFEWINVSPLVVNKLIISLSPHIIFCSGGLIGLLQLVIVLAVGDTLGGSSSYMTLASQWVIPSKLQATFPHLAKFRCGLGNWWQVTQGPSSNHVRLECSWYVSSLQLLFLFL